MTKIIFNFFQSSQGLKQIHTAQETNNIHTKSEKKKQYAITDKLRSIENMNVAEQRSLHHWYNKVKYPDCFCDWEIWIQLFLLEFVYLE